jgi:glycosyltransferase involved in cell wall biosynthesis
VNLALLIGHFPPGPFGGAELQAEAWAKRLADRHQVTVVTRRDPMTQPAFEERDGFRVVRIAVPPVPVLRTAFDLVAVERAVHGLSPRPDLMLCFQTFISGWAGVRAQQHLGIPAVVWVRGEGEYRLRASRAMRVLAPWVWANARGVMVQSEVNRVELLAELGHAAPGARPRVAAKIAVVPNGLDLPETIAPPGARVLSVGRLIPDKGMDVTIDRVARTHGLQTTAGEAPERARLEARARHHELDTRFPGFVGRADLDALYRAAWVVVLAARRGEGLPNVVLEAFAHGRPVVATPVAGVRDLVVDGVNGLLVPPGDPAALRDALARHAHARGLAERLGRAGRATAESFAWARVRPLLEERLAAWSAA